MSDIVERLRNWRTVHLARLHLLMEEAADEMERLSRTGSNDAKTDEWATESSNQAGKCPERECLTDEEREALLWLSEGDSPFPAEARRMAVVRGLLERLGGEQ